MCVGVFGFGFCVFEFGEGCGGGGGFPACFRVAGFTHLLASALVFTVGAALRT